MMFDQNKIKHTQVRRNSAGHQIGVYEQVKTSLDRLDIKNGSHRVVSKPGLWSLCTQCMITSASQNDLTRW